MALLATITDHTQGLHGDHGEFGIELTPWNVSKSYLANLTG